MNIYLIGSFVAGILVSLLYAWSYPKLTGGASAPKIEVFMAVFLWPFVLAALIFALFTRFRE